MVNLLQFDRSALGDWCEQRGEKPFRATQLFRWIHQRGEADFSAMSDLASRFATARPSRRGQRPADRERAGRERRHDQVAVRRRRGRRGRDRLHPGIGTAARLHLVAGRMRRQLPLLRDRPPGLQPQPDDGRDRRPALARGVRAAQAPARPPEGRARDQQRRDDGHGRAAAELWRAGAGAQDDARRSRLRPVAAPGHGVDLGRRADDRPPARRLPGRPRGLAARARRCAARRSRAAQPQVPDRRAARAARRYLERAPRDFVTIEYCMLDGVNDSPAQAEALLALLQGDGTAASPAWPARST